MSDDLNNRIRIAQIRAAEEEVIADAVRSGLIKLTPEKFPIDRRQLYVWLRLKREDYVKAEDQEAAMMCDNVIAQLRRDEAENNNLRAALAHSELPCAYCSLPVEDWGKCKSGFPGCARADDASGCPHLGDGLVTFEAYKIIKKLIGVVDGHISGSLDVINEALSFLEKHKSYDQPEESKAEDTDEIPF
jgi:transposase-like protein